MSTVYCLQLHSFKDFIYLFLDRGEGREKEKERNICVGASHMPPTGDLAHNPGVCPDWESNWRPFGSQAGTQFTESQQPGLQLHFFKKPPKIISIKYCP